MSLSIVIEWSIAVLIAFFGWRRVVRPLWRFRIRLTWSAFWLWWLGTGWVVNGMGNALKAVPSDPAWIRFYTVAFLAITLIGGCLDPPWNQASTVPAEE